MEKTIKEMADELGVSKQKVYRFIKKNHITTSSEAHQVMWYDEAVQTLVNTHFLPSDTVGTASKPHHEAHQVKRCDDVVQTVENTHFVEKEEEFSTSKLHQTTSSSDSVLDAVISMLQEELKGKNAQIEAQQKTISELTATLLKTTETLQASQSLHAGTIQTQLEAQSLNTSSEPAEALSEGESATEDTGTRAEEKSPSKGFWGRLFQK